MIIICNNIYIYYYFLQLYMYNYKKCINIYLFILPRLIRIEKKTKFHFYFKTFESSLNIF